MPFTWDANCFRGDSVTTAKLPGEYRVFVVGGSTVEDAQPDVDMWTRKLKEELNDPRIKVINAGQTNMGSTGMTAMYESRLSVFKPDLLLYYEGWNEQTEFGRLAKVEEQIGAVTNRLHKALHYKSLLYTYLVEKYSFMTNKDVKLWTIDVKQLHANLDRLVRVRAAFGRAIRVRHAGRADPATVEGRGHVRWRRSGGPAESPAHRHIVRVRHRGNQRAQSAPGG
jgi:hypothetical protein